MSNEIKCDLCQSILELGMRVQDCRFYAKCLMSPTFLLKNLLNATAKVFQFQKLELRILLILLAIFGFEIQ